MKANRKTSGVLKGLLLVTSALVASTVLGSSAARAGGPTGGQVAVGSATITSPNSNSTVVNQSSNKALINWDAFSIPTGSSVVFNQPTAGSVTVNRVTGPNASAIDGQLLANGNIWLINSNGIVFGQGAQVNVGGLLATTTDIDDDDFKNGKFRFAKPSSNPDAAVVNKGTIVAGQGGSVVLSASQVSNEGVIKADLGSIVLGGARTFTVDLEGDNLIRYQIGDPVAETPKGADGKPATALVSNSGTLSSSGGTVLMTARAVRNVENNVINNTGVVEANSVSVHNGEVIFDAGPDGTANVGGTVSASGTNAGETGGTISATGGTVNVADGAKLDASGDAGGGTIQIGGGLHGQGTIANAQTTTVGKAVITADAKTSGNGGTVSIWSDGQTNFNASVSAKGGASGGDGGLVETSGHDLQVGSDASVNTLAPNGLTGTWLLDPTNIIISSSGSDGIGGSNISPTTIVTTLATSNVFLEADNDITVNSAITYSSSHSLSLFAGQDLTFNASVQNAGNGTITGVGGWDPSTGGGSPLGNAGSFGNNNGSIFIGGTGASGNVSVGTASGLTRMFSYNLSLDATNGNAQLGYNGATGGDTSVNAIGTLAITAAASRTAQIGNGSTFGTSSGGGAITFTTASVTNSGTTYVAGQSLDIVLNSDGSAGNVGSAANPLQVAVNKLAVQTSGASAYIKSPGAGLSVGVGSDGINLGAGALSIVANGAITQTLAILAGSVNISATAGSITLTNSGNAFGPATLATTSGDATIYDSSALAIAGATIVGDLTLSSAGAISQTGAIQANTLSVTTTNGDITLSNTGNAFDTLTLSAGGTHGASIYDTSDLSITSASVATTLSLTGEGDIGQTGAILASTLNATSTGGSITLTNSGNTFNTTSLTTSAGDASLYDVSALTIANASVSGALSLSSAGNIGQTGAIHAASLSATSTGGDITLTNSGNAFASAALSTTGSHDASLYDASALTISSATIGRNLTLTGGSSIGQSGAIHAVALSVTASGNIALTNSSNNFGPVTLSTTGAASLYDAAALTVASANIGGGLTLSSGGTIGQTGAITAGTLSVTTTNGAITLTNASNSFGPLSATTSGSDNATFYDSANLVVASANVGGTLTLTGGGTIGQTGAIHAASISATTTHGAIDLSNTGNTFATATLATSGSDDASLYDASSLSLTSATIGGDLTLAGASSISQTGAIHAASLNVSTTSGPITLTNASNNFGPLTVATGASGDATIYDLPNLVVASANVGGTLTLSSGGTITQTGAIHAGALSATTTSGAITLTNTGNAINTATLTTSGSDNASLYDASNLTIASATVGGTLTLSGGGSIGQTGAVNAAALNVSTTGGAITLSNAANTFASATVATGGSDNATLNDASALSITSANVGGTLSLTSAGAISQTGAIHAATLNATSTGGTIVLTNSGNAFSTASLTTSGSYNASLYDASNLTISSVSIGGDLTLSGGGTIGQSGAIHTHALNVTTTNGAISLGNTGNTFNTLAVSTSGSDNALFTDASSLSVTSANVGGTLTLTSAGALSQAGDIHAAALNATTTGGNIVLTNTGNTFASASLSTSGSDDASLYDASALTITGATVGGTLTLTGASSIGQSGAIHATSLNATTTGGPITLTNAGNAFNTATVSTSGSDNASLTDSINLTVASANVGGTLTLTGAGSIGQSGAIHAAALNVTTTGGPITLTNTGNAFSTATVATSGSDNASLYDSTNLTVASANVGGTLTLTGAGSIGQTGAIHAASLIVSTTGGAITLTNSANAFATANLTTTAAYDASLYDSANLIVTGASIGGDLTLSGGGSIGQTGAIHADALSVTTTNGDITLTNSGNTFNTLTVTTSGSDNASLYDLSNLIVTSANVGGTLTLTGAGSIGQTGAIHSAALNVTTTGGDITLTNTGNAFNTASLTTSGSDDASLYDSTNLIISSANVGGDLALSGGGSIGQSGAIHAASLNVSTTGGPITLTNTGNAFGPLTVATANTDDASLYDSINLVVASANVGSTLTLTSGGALSQTGAIHAAALNASTTGGDIVLTNTGNTFHTATLSTQGSDNASLYDSIDLVIAGANVGGTLTLSGGGTIGQSGAIHAAQLNASTTGGDIVLTNSNNSFGTTTVSTQSDGDATLYTASNMIVASANVGGTLSLSGGGTIGQSGAIHAASLDVTTTHGDITLTNSGNAFDSATLSTAGSDNASLTDSIDLTMAGANVGGTLTLSGAGSIGQTGAIHAAVLNVATTGGDITLTNTGNTFNTLTVSTSGSDDASLYDASNLTVASANVGGTLTLSGGGSIGQSGAIHSAVLNVTTTGGPITLTNTGNTFNIASLATSGSDDASLYDLSNLVIASANIGGDLTLSDAGSIGQTGAIHTDKLTVVTTGGAITLTNTGNTINTADLTTSDAYDASLYDSIALTISAASIGGDLTLSGGSTIGQSGALHADGLNVTTTNGAVTLTNSGNTFNTLTVATSGSDNASFQDASALTVASANVGGTLTLSGASSIGQTGAIHAAALNVTTTGGPITLTNTGNAFSTATVATSGSDNASLTDSTNLTVASANVGGTLTLTGVGSIGQTGAIQATALNVTTTGGPITLTNAGNAFDTATLATSGSDNASLNDSTDLTIASATIGGTLTLTGGGSIDQTGVIHAAVLNVTTTGGPIDLSNTGNVFGTTTVSTSGSDDATLYDSTGVTVAGATVGGTFKLTAGGAIGQTGAINAAALNVTANSGNIVLTNIGNNFATATLSTLGDASLYDAANLTVAGANAGGTLALTGAGSIGQSGAIHAATLNVVTTGGPIDLTNAGNTFNTASLSTSGSDDASLYDAVALIVSGATVGGDLTLSGAGNIGQSGAIDADSLTVTTTGGAITLNNSGNAFNTATLTTSGSANVSLYDSIALTIASANIGGRLTLSGGGAIGQTGAIHAASLNVGTTSGAITLTNTGNAFATATLSTSGSDDASLYDSTALTIASANIGGDLTLSAAGAIGQTGAIHAATLDVSTTSGAIALTDAGNTFGTATISTSGSDNAALHDASALTVASANVGGTLTLTGDNGIGQSGAIHAAALNVSTTHGAIQLTNAGNSFATATVATTGADAASLSDSTALTIASANVGGNLTLSGGGAIGQSGAIHAASLNVSTTAGAITLTNTGNTFGPVTVGTSGSDNASLYDVSALVVASANVGGALTLSGGSTVSQTGAIHAASLNVTTTNGAITLGNAGNSFGTATLSTSGSDNATLYDGAALTVAGASIGGDLTLSGGSSIGQSGAIHTHALNVSSTGGAINLANAGNTFNTLTVATAGSSDATLNDASALTVASANVGGWLTLTSGGALGQSGAIHAATLNATTTSGAITLTNAGNSFANASLNTSGSDNASLYDASALTITSANVGGTLALSGAAAINQANAIHANNLTVASTGGAITLNGAGNAFNTASVSTTGSAVLYDGSSLTLTSANVGGSLTVLSQHDLTFVSSIQASTGLFAVAGWDETTTNPSSLTSGSAYGNNGGSIVIGGAGAVGDVAIGSQSGTTTLAGANISLTATNGYAQLGYHGAGTDAISVYAKGNVTLTGGAQAARFAQIGNGGYQVTGNQSGDIYISAAGDLALNGGAGQVAYAQIGHGGAQSNSGTNGYSDTGLITVSAKTATLAAGSGTGSYAQIGHGGYLSGQSLASGSATLGGNISLTTVSGIKLTGNGTSAYAQVGHGGDFVNSNAANGTSGSISGNITATATTKPVNTDPVTLIAGSGNESYAQIGNGGNAENKPVQGGSVTFTVSGNILISDLTLQGSNTGSSGYSQVGNGDASQQGTGNISGDITIGNGFTVNSINGTAPFTSSLIGNQTGFGTVTGLVTFLSAPPPPPPPPPPPSVGDSGGAIAVVIQKPTDTIVTTPVVLTTPPPPLYTGGDSGSSGHGPGPLEQLVDSNSDGKSSEGEQASDGLSESLGKSLDAGSHKVAGSETLMPGLTRQLGRRPHPVPPADVDYSSWGNEALWL